MALHHLVDMKILEILFDLKAGMKRTEPKLYAILLRRRLTIR
jgi:hypothetical protein